MVSTPHPQSLVDQIVPRDLHTGDVVHNHYYSPPVELQDTSNIQTSSKLDPSTAQYFSYKEIGAGNWIFIGVVSGLCSAFIPTVSAVTGFSAFSVSLYLSRTGISQFKSQVTPILNV